MSKNIKLLSINYKANVNYINLIYKAITSIITLLYAILCLIIDPIITYIPTPKQIQAQIVENEDLCKYTGEITYLSFNTLIAFPDKAFIDSDSNYDETKITTIEFKNILEQLYKNNYILVDIFDIYKIDNHKVSKQPLYLPNNKKPIVLTFENVTYKSSYQNRGQIDKIIIDRNNDLASYTTKKSIQDRVQYDNEFLLILENYLKSHPDFHHNNARGIIFVSGENGVLGYNTSHNIASSKYETKRAIEIINRLKKLGWRFGSNNYRYTSQLDLTQLEFAKDISLWNNEIKPIIKDTSLFSYPFGEFDHNNEQMEILIKSDFHIFFVNNSNKNDIITNDYVIINQIPINGDTLRSNQNELSHLFDCETIYDDENRVVPYEKNPQE